MLSLASVLLVAATLAQPSRSLTSVTPLPALTPSFALLDSPQRHVRTTDPAVRRLLRLGLQRSATFKALMTYLNASDVIVYIQAATDMPRSLSGRLLMLPSPDGQRYLRIQIAPSGTPNDLIAVIGHELRHAVEVADAPEVHDDAGLLKLYERIGEHSHGEHRYDTRAAKTTGNQVRKELSA